MKDQDIAGWLGARSGADRRLPVYRRIYARVRQGIAEGRLAAGQRVPSIRVLASLLEVSRGTVELAYQLLLAEGYLLARGPAGTVVAPGLTVVPSAKATPAAQRREPDTAERPDAPFRLGLPAMDAFPAATWTRCLARHIRHLDIHAMAAGDAMGEHALRAAIARHLGVARGIPCHPEQIVVTTGHRGSLELLLRCAWQPGESCWFEDPGYSVARRFLEGYGVPLVDIPVDANGLDVDTAIRQAPHARLAVVTPTQQSPLGVALSLNRRVALLDWAASNGAWILEDDYDSEFRYRGRPLPALKSLDRADRVYYAGSFSKTMYPGLRIGYLVVPESQLDCVRAAAGRFRNTAVQPYQLALAEFMDAGHFARHLKRMRALYEERRAILTSALERGGQLRVEPTAGGMHLLAWLDPEQDDLRIAALARESGLSVTALNAWRTQPGAPALLLGFTQANSKTRAASWSRRLHEIIEASASP